MIIVQVVRSYNTIRKLRVFRVCGDDRVDVTVKAGLALGARVNAGVLHWGLEGATIDDIERLIASVLK
jgi:hypothetical protein